MKLILKRIDHDPIMIMGLDDTCNAPVRRHSHKPADASFALHYESGEMIPGQSRVTTESLPGQCPTVTVTFIWTVKA